MSVYGVDVYALTGTGDIMTEGASPSLLFAVPTIRPDLGIDPSPHGLRAGEGFAMVAWLVADITTGNLADLYDMSTSHPWNLEFMGRTSDRRSPLAARLRDHHARHTLLIPAPTGGALPEADWPDSVRELLHG